MEQDNPVHDLTHSRASQLARRVRAEQHCVWSAWRRGLGRAVGRTRTALRGLSQGMYSWWQDRAHWSVRHQENQAREERLRAFLDSPGRRLAFPSIADPEVSIVVLSYRRTAQLLECLESVRDHTPDVAYELIVVDNASADGTTRVLGRVDGARVFLLQENLGFVKGNNFALAHARGRYLLLLNNDAIATPGWLSAMLDTIKNWPRCGAVGPRFLFPDGRLQEAGTICWNDGRVEQYGFGDDASAPEYQHVREVDYCSGAALLVRADLFRRLGGFDERYAPCYFEDCDLGFGLRSLGYCVAYQPASTVIHHGPGGDSLKRTVSLCAVNQRKYVDKWRTALACQAPGRTPNDRIAGRDRRTGPRILVLDHPSSSLPSEVVLENGVPTFLPLGGSPDGDEVSKLRSKGIEVITAEASWQSISRRRVGCYEAIVVGADVQEEGTLRRLRLMFPLTPIHLGGTPRSAHGETSLTVDEAALLRPLPGRSKAASSTVCNARTS